MIWYDMVSRFSSYIKGILMLMNSLSFTLHVSLCTKCWTFGTKIITFVGLRYLEVMPAFVLPL